MCKSYYPIYKPHILIISWKETLCSEFIKLILYLISLFKIFSAALWVGQTQFPFFFFFFLLLRISVDLSCVSFPTFPLTSAIFTILINEALSRWYYMLLSVSASLLEQTLELQAEIKYRYAVAGTWNVSCRFVRLNSRFPETGAVERLWGLYEVELCRGSEWLVVGFGGW